MYADHSSSGFIYSERDYLESLVRAVTPDNHTMAEVLIMVTKPLQPAFPSLMETVVTAVSPVSLIIALSLGLSIPLLLSSHGAFNGILSSFVGYQEGVSSFLLDVNKLYIRNVKMWLLF